MKKFLSVKHRTFCRSKLSAGASVVELLVSVVVLGVAIAGITDLMWMNTSWTRNFFNKTSASYSAQVFLKRLREDMNNAYRISDASNEQQLMLWLPTSLTKTSTSPFPPASSPIGDQVIYRLNGNTITRTANNSTWTILKGIVGPKKIGNSAITVFQYIPKILDSSDPNFGVQSTASGGVRSVVVDIEVLNRDYGKSKAAESTEPSTSDIMLRAEFLARNELSMEP